MTFSQTVKEELVLIKPDKTCCMLSELSALTQSCASLILMGRGKFKVRYNVQSPALAKLIFILLKERMGIIPLVQYQHHKMFGGVRILTLTVDENASRRLLLSLHMLRTKDERDIFKGIPRSALKKSCCQRAFVRGAFLGAGSLSSPQDCYHLSFSFDAKDKAEALQSILSKCALSFSLLESKNNVLLYTKQGDTLGDLFALMGANKSLMAFENIRITKQSREQANRALNCDSANFKKQLSVSQCQVQKIVQYSLQHSLSPLPPDLYQTAQLRMINPHLSIEQLGALFTPPLSKSGVHHRLSKLMAYIEKEK